jgi:hypothetical protein
LHKIETAKVSYELFFALSNSSKSFATLAANDFSDVAKRGSNAYAKETKKSDTAKENPKFDEGTLSSASMTSGEALMHSCHFHMSYSVPPTNPSIRGHVFLK